MAVYVDNFRAPATVGRIRGRWSHLTADTPAELHEFAARLGQRRESFQARCKYGKCPTVEGACAHWHYDVVDRKRLEAIALGALPIDIREMGALISARRAQFMNAGLSSETVLAALNAGDRTLADVAARTGTASTDVVEHLLSDLVIGGRVEMTAVGGVWHYLPADRSGHAEVRPYSAEGGAESA